MLKVTHTPFGQHHPYEQLPEERFPRQPLAGQPFRIGITTQPAGTAQHVVIHSLLDDAPQPPIAAALQADWQAKQEEGVGAEFLERMIRIDQDVWHGALTAPAFGHSLTYWVEADGVTTARHTVRGEVWTSEGASSRCALAQDGPTTIAPLRSEILTDGQHARRIRLTFPCQPDERFYGLGERFNALNQRGEILDVRVYEQYKSQGKRTYMPIPFLLSSAGYGLYVESSRWMQFDLAASAADVWTLEADLGDEVLPIHILTGDDPLAIVAQFTQLSGPAALPPEWVFGLWMSGNEWNSQARVEHEVRTSLEHGIQPAVLVIEAWSDETTFYIWNDAQYTPHPGGEAPRYQDFHFPADGKWPNPKGMVDWLHSLGIRVLLWQVPVLKVLDGPHPQHEADRSFYESSGFGVREADGTPYKVRPFWFRGGYLWDVTNPAERAWWLNKRAYLLDEVGIDGFKTDGGEHLWGEDTRFADGRSGSEVWNAYPRLYTEAYYNFARSRRDSIIFSRAGFTGSQRAPLHWAGDENSTWEAFRHSILAGLSAAVSGIPFWGWDFGGFSGEVPSAELYLRAAAMAVFCPIFQYHSEYNAHRSPSHDRTPWNIAERSGDARVLSIFRNLCALRQNLMPYIWREAQHSAATGEPMMRALQLWHVEASAYQYYFGRDLLVCPVVEEGAQTWTGYLPPGRWMLFNSSETLEGGRHLTIDAPLGVIPVFVREGALLE